MGIISPSESVKVCRFIVQFLLCKAWFVNLQIGLFKLAQYRKLFQLLEDLRRSRGYLHGLITMHHTPCIMHDVFKRVKTPPCISD